MYAIEILTNHLLSDQEKQKRVKDVSFTMIKLLLFLCVKCFALLLLTASPFYLADYFSLIKLSSLEAIIYSPINLLLIIVSFVVIFYYSSYKERVKKIVTKQVSDNNSYPNLYRVIHNIYYSSPRVQNILNALESKLFYKQWQNKNIAAPVFITSLPRSGTTILLETLNKLPETATFSYRDMPFIFSPLIWSKFSRLFLKTSDKKERAHGDGLFINENSPEAFEEALWFKFFPQKYANNRIYFWKHADLKFLEFFKNAIKCIIYLRQGYYSESTHYLSKNNANLARLPVLREIFPECMILVPLRDPIEQAASMYLQHLNFLEQHKCESFVKKYMADIGHFEFGELHHAIEFPELENLILNLKPEHADYWLAYWLSAFSYLNSCEGITLLSYSALCKDAEQSLTKICQLIGIEANKDQIHFAAAQIQETAERKYEIKFSASLVQEAQILYKKLLEKAV